MAVIEYGVIGNGERLHLFRPGSLIALCGSGPRDTQETIWPATDDRDICKSCLRRAKALGVEIKQEAQ